VGEVKIIYKLRGIVINVYVYVYEYRIVSDTILICEVTKNKEIQKMCVLARLIEKLIN
jgi:hypothetical protein